MVKLNVQLNQNLGKPRSSQIEKFSNIHFEGGEKAFTIERNL